MQIGRTTLGAIRGVFVKLCVGTEEKTHLDVVHKYADIAKEHRPVRSHSVSCLVDVSRELTKSRACLMKDSGRRQLSKDRMTYRP